MTTRHPVVLPGEEGVAARFGFASAFRAGDTVYVSGVIGRGTDGRVPDSEPDEYTSIFDRLALVLDAAGASMADVVELVSYHVDLHASLPAFMGAKSAAMPGATPAWTAIGCSALAAPGARVELRAVAVIDAPDATGT
ncbi:MAG: Rid family hydrolase [Ilumatobacteraceae bacterium]